MNMFGFLLSKEKRLFLQHYLKIEKDFIKSKCYQKIFFNKIKNNIKKTNNDTFKKVTNIEVAIYNMLAEFSLRELFNTVDTHIYPGLLTPYGKSIAKIYNHCIEYFEKNKIYTEEQLKIAKKNLIDRVFNY